MGGFNQDLVANVMPDRIVDILEPVRKSYSASSRLRASARLFSVNVAADNTVTFKRGASIEQRLAGNADPPNIGIR